MKDGYESLEVRYASGLSQLAATSGSDGTLWAEQPACVQGAFAFDRIEAMSAEHPD